MLPWQRDVTTSITSTPQPQDIFNREKSLRHVAIVAKFVDDNKPKRHLKSGFALFQTSSILLISFNSSNVGEIFWVKSERTLSKFRKTKTKFLCCAHLLHERALEIRKFHVAVVQLTTAKKCTKMRDGRGKMCGKMEKLPIFVTQKVCYHGNVTSHFSSLFCPLQPLHVCMTHSSFLL